MTKLVLKEYPLMSHDDIPVFLLMKATMVCWCSPISRKKRVSRNEHTLFI